MPLDYLLKTEPSEYSFADLQRDAIVMWDGVTSPAGVKHLREMSPGARLVIYETGNRKCVVGTATVVSVDASDPKNPAVKIKAGKGLANQISLARSRVTNYSRIRHSFVKEVVRCASHESPVQSFDRQLMTR